AAQVHDIRLLQRSDACSAAGTPHSSRPASRCAHPACRSSLAAPRTRAARRRAAGPRILLDTHAGVDGLSIVQPAAHSEGGRMSATGTTVARITNVASHAGTESTELYSLA